MTHPRHGSEMHGRVAIVTGGSSGMGAATARLLALSGARVLVADLDDERGTATVDEINEAGGTAAFSRVDVSDEDDVANMVATAVSLWGRLDCAVNNAALPPDTAPIVDLDVATFDRIVAVNLRSVALCLKYQLRQMVLQQSGSIVNLGSVSSVKARVHNPGYVATKHGVVGLTKTAALEHGRDQIRVNAVLPGGIDTPMIRAARAASGNTPPDEFGLSLFGRLGTPDEIAEACFWLCSDRSSYVTGHSLAVDAGFLAR
ncbi:SDR family NAD(P)-dependent oxidoreductase [Gordonia sp. NPDC058843]|uniref:SDR family NAD(P)-dependent oxidoreductase n=1 Tax=Gordonia sp. NPDC058843 TaxID=3346648 RepID=UPI0036A2E0A2